MKLKDKVIVITGGSRGLGKALAQRLCQEKSHVIISSNNKESLELTASELLVDCLVVDVTSHEDIKKLGKYVIDKYGKIDFWINNAGIQIAPSLVEEVDVEKMRYLFEVNFFGYFYGCQVALLYMKKQNSGVIININSSAGLEGKPYISAYCSSKFAIKGLTESIRKELKDLNIKMYEVFPGGIQTEIYKEKYPEDFDKYMEVSVVVEKIIANLKLEKPTEDLVIKRPLK